MKYGTQTEKTIESVGKELRENPPKILAHTAEKFGPARAAKQKTAILLSKSRKLGATVPKAKSMGGL